MKKGEFDKSSTGNTISSDTKDTLSSAYSLFNRLTATLARDLQEFLVLSPAHDISANHLQIVVHLVKVVGVLSKKIEVWATITDTKYVSKQVKLLTITVTKDKILQIMRDNELLQYPVSIKQYGDLRDIICTQCMTLLLHESDLRSV